MQNGWENGYQPSWNGRRLHEESMVESTHGVRSSRHFGVILMRPVSVLASALPPLMAITGKKGGRLLGAMISPVMCWNGRWQAVVMTVSVLASALPPLMAITGKK